MILIVQRAESMQKDLTRITSQLNSQKSHELDKTKLTTEVPGSLNRFFKPMVHQTQEAIHLFMDKKMSLFINELLGEAKFSKIAQDEIKQGEWQLLFDDKHKHFTAILPITKGEDATRVSIIINNSGSKIEASVSENSEGSAIMLTFAPDILLDNELDKIIESHFYKMGKHI